MKTNFRNALLCLAALLLVALPGCGGDEAESPVPKTEIACRLVDRLGGAYIEYNDKGLVGKIGTDLSYTTYKYDNAGKLIRTENYFNDVTDGYKVFFFNNDILDKINSYSRNGTPLKTESFIHNDKKQLIEIVSVSIGDGSETLIKKFTYNANGNIVAEGRWLDGEKKFEKKYEDYDDKMTPVSALKGYIEAHEGTRKNNPRKLTEIYFRNEQEISRATITYTYTYNDKGFPTKIVKSYGWNIETTDYTYQCN